MAETFRDGEDPLAERLTPILPGLLAAARRILSGHADELEPEELVDSAVGNVLTYGHAAKVAAMSESEFEKYFKTIMINKFRDKQRQKNAGKRHTWGIESLGADEEATRDVRDPHSRRPSEAARVDEAAERVREALAGLPDDERAVMELVAAQASRRQIAKELGQSLSWVRHRIEKAVARLRPPLRGL